MPTRKGSVITAITASAAAKAPIINAENKIPFHKRLRIRLLLLICICVIITEALVFVPSIANRQHRWFENQHRFAYALSLSVYRSSEYGLEERSLTNHELIELSIISPNGFEKFLLTEQPSIKIDKVIDLDQFSDLNFVVSAFRTLFFGGNRVIQVIGKIGEDGTKLSLLTRDYSLRMVLFQFTERFFISSLAIALIVAIVIYLLVTEILLRPVYKIYANMLEFVMEPDNPKAILVPENRHDEIGLAQQRIAAIETELQSSYAQQKHLAQLGLAISKINHDMRNLLASAQLVSDRLASVEDPLIKRLSSKLIRTIDRAINYTNGILTYGRIQEQPPQYQQFILTELVDDVIDIIEPHQYGDIIINNLVDPHFTMQADCEQIHRILTNLCRNGVQALAQDNKNDSSTSHAPKQISIAARHEGQETIIDVYDTGPGLPEHARQYLFEPFQGSVRSNGTGLGLAICYELVRAHSGTIRLIEEQRSGTHFEIRIPLNPENLVQTADEIAP